MRRGITTAKCGFGYILLLSMMITTSANAQLVSLGKKDQFLRLSAFKSSGTSGLVGAFSGRVERGYDTSLGSNGDQVNKPAGLLYSLQFDYGSLAKTVLTATGTEIENEGDAAKNSGVASISYVRRLGFRQALFADLGVEHKRFRMQETVAGQTIFRGVDNKVSPTAGLRFRYLGSFPQADPNQAAQRSVFAYLLQPGITVASALTPAGNTKHSGFIEPTAVLLYTYSSPREQEGELPLLTPLFQARVQAGMMYPLGSVDRERANIEASVSYFFQSDAKRKSGIELRHFNGYFEHNLRDRKKVTSLNLILFFG